METEEKRMKYIDADKIKAEIERLRHEWPPTFTEGEKQHLHYYFRGLNKVLHFVESMQQEEPLPPDIEEESQKKGWLDYGLTMGEIGLHLYNAIHRLVQMATMSAKKIEQKPAWSEEDEHTLQGVIDEIQANKNQAPDYDLETYDRFLSWLKSLKNKVATQKQWKPSDAQMQALKEACDKHWEPDGLHPLYTLYQQLKKQK